MCKHGTSRPQSCGCLGTRVRGVLLVLLSVQTTQTATLIPAPRADTRVGRASSVNALRDKSSHLEVVCYSLVEILHTRIAIPVEKATIGLV